MNWTGRVALACLTVILLASPGAGQLADVVDRVRPSVVFVLATLAGGETVSGTGFVVDRTGFILTASHIFDAGYQKISIRLSDGRTVDADLWDRDKRRDIAVLKIEADALSALTFAAAAPRQGDEILLFGFPQASVLGSAQVTVTRGIVSAFNERLQLLQVDAAANPGNSGGPVINTKGEVVGMLIGGLREAAGLNFVVPAEPLKEFAESYVGKPKPAISAQPTPSELLASRLVVGVRMGPILVQGNVSAVSAAWGEPETKEPAPNNGMYWNYVTRRVFLLVTDNRVQMAITMSPAYRTENGWGVGRSAADTRALFGAPPSTESVKDGTIWVYQAKGVAVAIQAERVAAVMIFQPGR